MPVYNGEKYLSSSLDSLINQSIGMENLEIIIVNDASTDNTREIIEDYRERINSETSLETVKAIHLEENIGGAYGPRNIALDYVSGKYVMFLDSDDSYPPDACEILYDKIEEYGSDIAFGRYLRHYPEQGLVRKSYSPFKDDFKCDDDLVKGSNLSGALGFLWKHIFSYFFYGRLNDMASRKSYASKNSSELFIKNINEESSLLKILPSFWTKIYRADLIKDNEIRFPDCISAEDLNFLLDAYFHSDRGILFLNDLFVYNYYMRMNVEEKSVTKNINFRLVYDSIRAYRLASEKCDEFDLSSKNLFLNPYLLNWISLWFRRDNSKEENKLFLEEINKLERGQGSGFKYWMLLKLMKCFLIILD